MTGAFQVFARDNSLSNLGTINGYTNLSVTPRFNAVGSWALTYPIGSLGAKLLGAGRGVRIFRQGLPAGTPPLISGPITGFNEVQGDDRKTPQVQFTGVCDNFWLSARRALPDPTVDADTYTDAYDTRVGVGETIMKQYVNLNAGPGALAARIVPGLILGPNLTRGGSASYSARLEALLQALQSIAATAGLGFWVRQIGSQLVFDCYVPQDRRKLVRFDVNTKSLGSYSYGLTGPTADAIYVGDSDPGTGRSFKRYTDDDVISDWGRIETFVDQSGTSDPTQLDQAGAQALVDGSPQAQVSFEPRDTPQHRYGLDFGLGDTVTVRTRLGDVADVVREVTITDTASDGVKIRPTVGGSQASDPDNNSLIYKSLAYLARTVGYLQRRL